MKTRDRRFARCFPLLLLVAIATGVTAANALAKPRLVEGPSRGPAVLWESGGDTGQNVQDQSGRTIRATREPWQGYDRLTRSFKLRRFTSNGHLDRRFAQGGETRSHLFGHKGEDWFFADPLIGADGSIVVVGQLPGDGYYNRAAGFEIQRFTTRGVLDRSFSGDGVLRRTVTNSSRRPQFEVDDSALDVHGNIWLCGMTSTTTRLQSATAFAIAADGSGELPGSRMNFTVAAGRSTSCRDITSSGDGAIIVAATDDRKIEAIKRTAIGVLDPDFGESGVATIELAPPTTRTTGVIRLMRIAQGPLGQVIVSVREEMNVTSFRRFSARGVQDLAFGESGSTTVPFVGNGFWPQADGGVLIGGWEENIGFDDEILPSVPMLVRIRADGTRDPAWNKGKILSAPKFDGEFGERLSIGQRDYFGPVPRPSRGGYRMSFQRVTLR